MNLLRTHSASGAVPQHDTATSRRRRPAVPVCGCGQDLDVGSGRTCPRCGTRLHLAIGPGHVA